MIEGVFVTGIEGLEQTGGLRHEVFTGDLGMPVSFEKDFYDHFAHHLLVKDGDELVATGRLVLKDDAFLIGRIAVKKEARGNQYGDLVVRMLIDRAFNIIGGKEVVVHSILPAQDFYKKIGFKAVGEPYVEATLEHITMVIRPEDLNSGCSGCKSCV